jgi:hypothetical protein
MKRHWAIRFAVLAVLTTASGVMARADVVRANIPFGFTVENKSLPAGTYEITRSLGNVIRIQNTHDPHIVTQVATIPDSTESQNKSVLIFQRYGDRYFLHDVFAFGEMNVRLFVSKEEKQIRQQRAMLKLPDPRQILILPK